MEGFCHVLPQFEIPEWFKHQRFGSFRPIPSNLFSNKNWKGIALCVIFVVPAHSNDGSPGEDTKYFHEFYCRLEQNGDPINGDPIAFKVPKETCVDSFGVWLYISLARFRKCLDERSCITPFIGTNSPDIEINMCGARILYNKQDVGEFLQNLGQKIVGSPNDLRGELNSHSQLSRLYQIASPPRWFAYQHGPAIKTQLPADLHYHSRWRPTPVTELLPSNETIQGECTSRETIFSNQVIAAGTSKSSSQGSLYLGKISSSLECWLKHGPYLQDHYECPGSFNQCLPQSEIPGWFKSKNIARSSSVTIKLPPDLYENLEWMGFAFFAVFSFQKHPTSVPMKGSEFSFIIVCHLKTNLGCMNPLYSISEKDVIISLHQRGFLWLSFIPCWILSPEWSRCTSVEFSFVSDSSAVSALKCGVDLVYRQKLEFARRMVQCITSYDAPFPSYERFPFYHPDQFRGSDGSSGTSGHYSYDQFYRTAALDFHPSTSYNFCFPPSKIQDWFSHPNHGHSVTIDLPSNLYHDSNWMGLVLYASFSINGDPNIIFSNLASGKSHFLYCQCQTSMANVDNQKIAFSTNKEEITWLLNLGEFIWICYVPGKPFKNLLRHCSHIEASFESDWSGVIVQNCALQLLYQHDQVQFEQELKHCNKLISENRKLVCKQQEDQKKKNELETDETEIQLGQSDLLENQEKVDKWRVASKELTKISGEHLEKGLYDLLQKMDRKIICEESEEPGRRNRFWLHDGVVKVLKSNTANKLLCRYKFGEDFNPSTSYNCCFPPSKIQNWFSHQNHGCSARMDLPSNLYHNSNWMGLVLYSSFSIQGDSNFILSNLNSGKSHSLFCQCQMSMANVDDQTIAFSTSKEEITWLLKLGEFIWISYVPGEPFKKMLQHCSRIEASFLSDWPGVIVQNCALQLLYQHDQVQFEQELKHCNNLISENRELIRKQQEDQKKRNEQYHVDEGLQRKIFSNISFEAKIPPRLIDQPETDETEIQLGQSDLLENQEKVDQRRVASKEPTKISGEHLEKGPYDLLQKMDREIIREESEEPGRCITANKLLCKFGEESNNILAVDMSEKPRGKQNMSENPSEKPRGKQNMSENPRGKQNMSENPSEKPRGKQNMSEKLRGKDGEKLHPVSSFNKVPPARGEVKNSIINDLLNMNSSADS
ncbi:uncharacterized protein LOC126723297 isoform X2 [Quercus robur]|uniref:uncharacterized protein LOC126723297 isoform X2 n=1 Tax=Quercus robur TaxID=38942 RepID=UPI0021625BC7|nr:uncharacterized protein LOC126723297 isoform X2 [Quercus robur]